MANVSNPIVVLRKYGKVSAALSSKPLTQGIAGDRWNQTPHSSHWRARFVVNTRDSNGHAAEKHTERGRNYTPLKFPKWIHLKSERLSKKIPIFPSIISVTFPRFASKSNERLCRDIANQYERGIWAVRKRIMEVLFCEQKLATANQAITNKSVNSGKRCLCTFSPQIRKPHFPSFQTVSAHLFSSQYQMYPSYGANDFSMY